MWAVRSQQVIAARAERLLTDAEGPKLTDGADEDASIHVFYTAIPGIPFNAFTHATPEPAAAATRIAFGKPYEEKGELSVPVGIQVNHAFIDGRALGELYRRAVDIFENPESSE